MKRAILPVSLFLLLILLAALAGCSKSTTTAPNTNPPNAPSNFAATQSARQFVSLNWTVADADTVTVESATDTSAWQTVAILPGTATSLNDSAINANKFYHFRAKARNSYGSSDYSAQPTLWTLPAVRYFSQASDLSAFAFQEVDGGATYATWTLDPNEGSGGAGKITITTTDANQRYVSVATNADTMPNSGWFESKIKVAQWVGLGNTANYANFFVERDKAVPTDNVVALFFSGDSTIFGIYSSGSGDSLLHREATHVSNPHGDVLPILTANAWHTVRLFHLASHWDLYIDGTIYWSGTLENVASGSYKLVEEWQFDRGSATNISYWIDEVANPGVTPLIVNGTGSSPDSRAVAKRK